MPCVFRYNLSTGKCILRGHRDQTAAGPLAEEDRLDVDPRNPVDQGAEDNHKDLGRAGVDLKVVDNDLDIADEEDLLGSNETGAVHIDLVAVGEAGKVGSDIVRVGDLEGDTDPEGGLRNTVVEDIVVVDIGYDLGHSLEVAAVTTAEEEVVDIHHRTFRRSLDDLGDPGGLGGLVGYNPNPTSC
ncbi:hypothetical protein ABKA04_006940 [Annulohypoxylon sp. FPYF3050]